MIFTRSLSFSLWNISIHCFIALYPLNRSCYARCFHTHVSNCVHIGKRPLFSLVSSAAFPYSSRRRYCLRYSLICISYWAFAKFLYRFKFISVQISLTPLSVMADVCLALLRVFFAHLGHLILILFCVHTIRIVYCPY